nr:IS3 family transposase [Sporolactobacillus shoreae]
MRCLSSSERATRTEQTQVVTELRQNHSLTHILQVVPLPKSIYYYQHNQLQHSQHENDDRITAEIMNVKHDHPAYGYRRVTLALQRHHILVNHKKVQHIMSAEGLQSTAYTQRIRKYNSYKGMVGKVAKNHLKRRFMTDRPYQKLVSDISEFRWGHQTTNERLYLEPVMDLYSDEILSFNISDHPTVAFALKPLHEALERLPEHHYRTYVHTDQGFQYQNYLWRKELKSHHVCQSMSRKATCLDNAQMESFFHLMKAETVASHHYQTSEELEAAMRVWMKYYNECRIKEKLGGQSPIDYRISTTEQAA